MADAVEDRDTFHWLRGELVDMLGVTCGDDQYPWDGLLDELRKRLAAGAASRDAFDLPRVDEDGCYTLPDGDCVGCPHCPHHRVAGALTVETLAQLIARAPGITQFEDDPRDAQHAYREAAAWLLPRLVGEGT